ncbi:hypothetical protein B5G34_16245 [Flavonifractor sp. An82]|uniref:aldolase catalytic domain-containing protein n=1 Tax=Flavonifractor sp. An82 TaxID=1965660 RepID=UPI000B39B920|nr:aldolase catalytic domain-containing protein [Flavonifractor sp. An82]OUN20037.1 hypothetical protein B5G34_16245 [Flavonifractor sp. An82]
MKKPLILDCTLRDGGYINQWHFGNSAIYSIVNYLNEANIDIIECGFLKDCTYNSDVSIFSSTLQITPFIFPKKQGTMYVAMIALGDISPDKILPCDGSSIDGIRLTFHKHEWEEAKQVARALMDKGYQIFIQPVGTTSYSDEELLQLIQDVNNLRPFALYLVDTLGILYRHDLLRLFYLIDHNLHKDIYVGFHSHNNLQLSFSNAQELMRAESSRKIIIDASVYGMGRGVGNLSTELLAEYINVNIGVYYSITSLLTIADQFLMSIYAQQRWGYDLPYFLSATENCHPNYASFLLNKGTLSIADISKILSLLPVDKRDLYDIQLIKDLYHSYQNCQIRDDETRALLSEKLKGRNALILCSGASLNIYKEQIISYIKKENPFVISVNFISPQYEADMLFVSNRKRLDLIRGINKKPDLIIATSNLIEVASECVNFVNYSSFIGEGRAADNAGAMLVRILKSVGVSSISIAGMDGFDVDSSNNYCISTYMHPIDRVESEAKNKNIARQLRLALSGVDYHFITPTKYEV